MRNEEKCVCSARLIVATRSSGPPASGKIIKELPGLVASGTPCIMFGHKCCLSGQKSVLRNVDPSTIVKYKVA